MLYAIRIVKRDRTHVGIPTIVSRLCIGTLLMLVTTGHAQVTSGIDHRGKASSISPTERVKRSHRKPRTDHNVVRPLDGFGNNRSKPEMNVTGTPLRRYLSSAYTDGFNEMSGHDRPDPREISNQVFAQSGDRPNQVGATDFVWQWGQFLDHDIDLTGGTDPPEDDHPIIVPVSDPYFDPNGVGGVTIAFNRSLYDYDLDGIRQQTNEITGWIDASNVYGSDDERSAALRTLDGTGRLKTSGIDNLLPNNDDGLANDGGDSASLFLAGDVRANEQVALTALHTLFVREHNRWTDVLHTEDPQATGEELFQHARNLVAAEMQHITYTEFLPVLLGARALPRYKGYRPRSDPRLMNVFSTAAFRLGHSMLSPTLLRLDENGEPIAAGHLPLRNGFFAPDEIRDHGIAPLLRGLATQVCQDVDSFVIDDVRNFLFGIPGSGGFDLVSLNIQRGRDHGLPNYNEARRALNLAPATSFADISSDPEVATRLERTYRSVDDIDLWVGGMAEDRYRNSMLGEVFHTLVTRQFEALRDGDRFWYAKVLSRRDKARVTALRLADIIRLNTPIGNEIQGSVFRRSPKRRQHRTRRKL